MQQFSQTLSNICAFVSSIGNNTEMRVYITHIELLWSNIVLSICFLEANNQFSML